MLLAMADSSPLEVTITHKLKDPAEVLALFEAGLIALDFGRKGPDLASYVKPKARQSVQLFHRMREEGAAVIAAYKGATDKGNERLIGWVEPGTGFERLNGLLCLRLTRARIVDAAANFLGNLPPRQCTLQRCHKRAKGKLAAMVLGTTMRRDVSSLHHRDVEWLVTNFLVTSGHCRTIWSGARSFENVDHVGYIADGKVLLAQTTVSRGMVGKKVARLRQLASDAHELWFFGPESTRSQCQPGVRFEAIEGVFAALEKQPHGRWLIDTMLGTAPGSPPRRSSGGDRRAAGAP